MIPRPVALPEWFVGGFKDFPGSNGHGNNMPNALAKARVAKALADSGENVVPAGEEKEVKKM